jgi:hypothetical protein
MLEFIPKSIFTNHFTFRAPDHALVELDASQWREVARFRLKEGQFAMQREGEWSGPLKLRGDFVLVHNGNVVARAKKVSVFRSTFEVEAMGGKLMLQKESIFRRTFVILENDRQSGSIRRANFWSRRTLVNLPAKWPVYVQVFLFWLVLLMWNRQDASS